jgi:purine-binding chemotaxis protein CheW
MPTAAESAVAHPPGQFLSFAVAGDEYAVAVLRVREILEYEAVTHVPGVPPWILGVINLRGSVVPVVDLAVKLGLPRTTPTRRTCIVIVEAALEGQHTAMGVIADSVSQVLDLRAEDVEPPPSFGTRLRVDYLVGMGKVGRGFVLMLDIDRVLSTDELLLASRLEAEEAPSAPGQA